MPEIYLRELPSGDLLADPGGEVPDVPQGYHRDEADPFRMHLDVVPQHCADLEPRRCLANGSARWWCRSKQVMVNPGACCRCQGLLPKLTVVV